MHVVATAGHVDHGKSALVRALTGMEPDRYAEERRRGMTIDLGYAWTTVAGEELAFVDVPGHERFIGTMLAGLGPAPAVLFVVAADEGWRRQSSEHLAAIDALGLRHGLLVVTRSDLADPASAVAEGLERLTGSSLGRVPAVAVSAVTGEGLDELRTALGALVARLPSAEDAGRVRLWVDRCFTIRGAGTVVTGTLGAGTLAVGDELGLGDRTVRVRGLQSLGAAQDRVPAVARVAVNLRGVEVDQVGRGDALLTPGAWRRTSSLDAGCLVREGSVAELTGDLVLHLGTAAVPVRVRPLGGELARLTLAEPLPVTRGDRLVLRDPGRHAVAAGAVVLDADPPALRRRGDAARWARTLGATSTAGDREVLAEQVRRRGAVQAGELAALGVSTADRSGVLVVGPWLVDRDRWARWLDELRGAVAARAASDPLDPRLSADAARQHLGVPDRAVLVPLVEAAGLAYVDGRIARAEAPGSSLLGAAEQGLAQLEAHLRADPFSAPERPDLERWGLGVPELAAAERVGRVVRLTADVVLLPTGPALAMRVLAGLAQPFTTSQARAALGTTRRVAVPLLEHLDKRGWTQRLDDGHRRVRGGGTRSSAPL